MCPSLYHNGRLTGLTTRSRSGRTLLGMRRREGRLMNERPCNPPAVSGGRSRRIRRTIPALATIVEDGGFLFAGFPIDRRDR